MKGTGSAPDATLLLTVCLAVATVLMFFLGYRATREWDRSTRESVQSRGNEVLALLSVALERDMKGGQTSALLPFNQRALEGSSLYDLADRFAGLFARFPYLESIFVWKDSNSPNGLTYFFNRAERLPPWDDEASEEDPYPVNIRVDPPPVRTLVGTTRARASSGAAFVLVQTVVGGAPYQTLVHLLYSGANRLGLTAAVGFTVNLDWVRQHYFADLINQVAKIGGDPTIRIEIRDEANAVVAETGPDGSDASAVKTEAFPLAFSDRGLLRSASGDPVQIWSARVDVSRSATLLAARSGSTNTLELLAFGACVAMVALVLTVRASRAANNLALRQSEFVAAVTHEMKTPLSLITLTSNSLAHGRYASPDTISDYGRLIGIEAHNLTRLVDNVLCYARLVEARSAYSFETVDLVELVGDSMERFRLQVEDAGCDVHLDLPLVAPPIKGDRGMLQDALDNLIDNALKHGGSGGYLLVRVQSVVGKIAIEVTDRGDGIAAEDLARVFDKFYRGRGTKHGGSGLGLTIARRIIEEHGGTIEVRSAAGKGTSVTIGLPQHDT
ncbi:MAG TPA: HAMP domain-containing sensor histidine kinase [Vicinamibacterales bacterium]|jgi:signal transduction histidine kinase|nr:HAMP domain-containing sensor histidine kinase [Vicinamibacterales bacterium]